MNAPIFTRAEYDEFERVIVAVYDTLERECEAAAIATFPMYEMVAARLRAALPDVASDDRQKVVQFLGNVERFQVDSYAYRLTEALRLIAAQRDHCVYNIAALDGLGLVDGVKPTKRATESYGSVDCSASAAQPCFCGT